ncbi:TPA_exp: Uncharacterized protein A8136_3946 [Trichophyton benhamiae CBS 112371]|uniref:Uncharacterized protein n=1 Tax=Arthroderma benhamiae (strain ATCC MYA-4681 / CBS 112371) TaxID=663331 RepID=D4B1X8_ARTBC|nr:uncharacterized protein ARB_02459 [Trichophyton benhamiae CBS 112371]EFE30760.1 hypothetical protein ARB_02459 [Trichophyton benhamiae CBS 112371]DAA73960.1 TPA_exp: Uncharacterized protein A8136_3946 [Trichophyton benhamiae CBS 112371]
MQSSFMFALAVAILSSVTTGQLLPPSIVPEIQPYPSGAPILLVSGSFNLGPASSETAYPAPGDGDDDDENGDDENDEESPVITGLPGIPGDHEPKTLDPEPSATTLRVRGDSSIQMLPESTLTSASIMTRTTSQVTSSEQVPSTLIEASTLDPTSLTRLIPEPSTMSASTLAPRATQAYPRRRRQARHAGYTMTTSTISISDPTSRTQIPPESTMSATTLATVKREHNRHTNGVSNPRPHHTNPVGVYPSVPSVNQAGAAP